MSLKTSASTGTLKVPGPGAYSIDRQLGQTSYSFGLKGTTFNKKVVPGPG